MAAAPVGHFEIMGKDAAKLQSFYATLFDWEINANNPMNYGVVEKAEGGIGGGIAADPEGAGGHVTVYAAVDDPQAALDQAEALGGKTLVPVTEVPEMVTFALFADPEGNVVGVVKN